MCKCRYTKLIEYNLNINSLFALYVNIYFGGIKWNQKIHLKNQLSDKGFCKSEEYQYNKYYKNSKKMENSKLSNEKSNKKSLLKITQLDKKQQPITIIYINEK